MTTTTEHQTHPVRPLEPSEFREATDLFRRCMHLAPVDDVEWDRIGSAQVEGRVHGVRDGETLVGTTLSFPTTTVVPGGARVRSAWGTGAGVRSDRRRRGVLRAIMTQLLQDCRARDEVLFVGRPTETAIYGRYGMGAATRARNLAISVDSSARFRDLDPRGEVRVVETAEALLVVPPLYERLSTRVGMVHRWKEAWARDFAAYTARGPLVALVHSSDGVDDGYVLATYGPSRNMRGWGPPHATLVVRDMQARDVGVLSDLWKFLADIDMVDRIEASVRPLDDPVELLLKDPRDCAVTAAGDDLWVQILDVESALTSRTFHGSQSVRLRVTDPLFPDNDGVYLIAPDGAAKVSGAADLESDVTALAMAYLGDRLPSELVAAGFWRSRNANATAAADALFSVRGAPWCGSSF